ncbi:hypothetical protein ENUP19_0259G0053 [Entamoeba nuttalli]
MMNERLSSFDPIIPSKPLILILGSMPGTESLKKQQYYGHPQNCFWSIISSLKSMTSVPPRYEHRIELIKSCQIALWDVCCQCERKGSLDSDIKEVKPNKINKLLIEHPTIKTVLFNGQGPSKLYHKFFKELPNIKYIIMPGTSPANARTKKQTKIEIWKKQMFVI